MKMKVKLFDNTEFEAQVKEEKDSLTLTMEFKKMSEWFAIGELLVNSNLGKVVVTYDDKTYSEYKNLKFVGSNMIRVSNTYNVVVALSAKTEFEMNVDLLNKTVKEQEKGIVESTFDITKMQIALAEVFERLLATKGGAE